MPNIQQPQRNFTDCELGCPLHSAMRPIRRWIFWFAAAVAATSLYSVPCEYDETFCGVWGCFPPLMALLSLHLLWLVALSAGLHEIYARRHNLLFPAGLAISGISLFATALMLGIDLQNWLGKSPSTYEMFWPNRLAYKAMTFTDAPLIEGILIGLVAILLGSRLRRPKECTPVIDEVF